MASNMEHGEPCDSTGESSSGRRNLKKERTQEDAEDENSPGPRKKQKENEDADIKRSGLIHCNELTVDVEYIKKKKGHTIPGSNEAIRAITACINSGKGGIVTLRQNVDHAKQGRKKVSSEDFDNILDEHFKKYNQTKNFEMETFNPTTEFRKIFVKAVDQQNILSQSFAYEKLTVSTSKVHPTQSHVDILARDDIEEELPEFKENFVFNQKLKCDNEHLQMEFKESGIDQVEKKFEEKCGKYISAFANRIGGCIMYGIKDDSTITDNISSNEKRKFGAVVARNVENMVWYHADDGFVQPEKDHHWKLNFVPVRGVPGGKECMVVILTVPFFKGIVYFRSPNCPVFDAETGQVTELSCEQWFAHLEEQCPDERKNYRTDLPAQFERLQLCDPDKEVVALNGYKPSDLRKKCLETRKGKYTVWSDIPEEENPAGITALIDSCRKSERGVIVVCKFPEVLEMNSAQPSDSCDVLVISDKKGVQLINVGATDQALDTTCDVAKKLDETLRKHFLKEKKLTQFVLCHHTCTDLASVDLVESPRPTASFTMTTSKLDALLEALVVTLNCTKSTFSQLIGEQILFLLTDSQCKLLWEKMCQYKTLFIHGLAGTGKTIMARIIAEHLMYKYGRDTVLYVCENQPLRDFMRRYGIQAVCREAFKRMNCNHVHHIIVDEAQNFRYKDKGEVFDWYEKAKIIVQSHGCDNPSGYLWVFLDMSQKHHRLFSGVPRLNEQPATHIMREVVRNPEHVFKAVEDTQMLTRSQAKDRMFDSDDEELWERCQTWYEDEVFPNTKIVHGVKGHFKQIIVNSLKPQNVAKTIMTIVKKHRDANCKVNNMVVLVSTQKDVAKYCPQLRHHAKSEGIRVVTDPNDQEEGCLALESVRRFNGLERAVVIAVNLYAWEEVNSRNRLYIQAISRSMMNAYLIQTVKLDFLPLEAGYSVFGNQKQHSDFVHGAFL